MNKDQEGINLPLAMLHLPVTDEGYRKPWFVKDNDFRVTDDDKYMQSCTKGTCWICGYPNKKGFAFVTGPKSASQNLSIEPPCHPDCARYAVQVCPFILYPKTKRRENDLPEMETGVGFVSENPGEYYITVVKKYKIVMTIDNFPALRYKNRHVRYREHWREGKLVSDSESELL